VTAFALNVARLCFCTAPLCFPFFSLGCSANLIALMQTKNDYVLTEIYHEATTRKKRLKTQKKREKRRGDHFVAYAKKQTNNECILNTRTNQQTKG
jgi:hypothetical protein